MSRAIGSVFGWIERSALYLGLALVAFLLIWNRVQKAAPIHYDEQIGQMADVAPGEWASIEVPFDILRPECRLSLEEPRRLFIRAPLRDPLFINQIQPIDIRAPGEPQQRRTSFNLRFEVPVQMPEGQAEVWVKSIRECRDPLFVWITHKLEVVTPKYSIDVVAGAGEGGEQ